MFYKVRREKNNKGKDSLYSFRSGVVGNEPRTSMGGDGDSMVVIDVEGDAVDVDGIDDQPSLPAKRSAAVQSTNAIARSTKKSKVAKKVPRKSLVEGVTAMSNGSQMISPPSLVVTSEERRLNRRRAELEAKIQSALEARPTSVPALESNRVVCIPIRIDAHPSTSTLSASAQQPLALKNGEIVLSSKLFSHLSMEQLQLLRRLETPKVLEILTAEFKKSLMEEYRAKKVKAKPVVTSNGANLPANANLG